jgi:phage baseplate assembly protein W
MAVLTDITSTHWTFDINTPGRIVQGLQSIKQCVLLILTTQKGTDPLRPDFGCSAFDFIDQPVNVALPRMIKAISESLIKYEPRIEEVRVSPHLTAEHLRFTISYKVKNTKSTDQLNITYGGATNP